jgi:serine/threonine protein kinase/tetratricopeptide (TPR) repeat protein
VPAISLRKDIMIGQTIAQYKILEKLGEGGMGVVYKAHDPTLDRFVALKFLPNYLTTDAAEKERFYHEARAASALSHPNVTTIYEIKEFEGTIYLAMEYVEGKTLKKVIHDEPPAMKKILEIAIQACDGLAAAHEKGVVHRDIKSDNIMLTPKGQVKIMDFGLAKVKGATKITKAGSTLGTAAYMSPEQAQGEEVDHRTDIFSFGVVLYELLAGKLPFRGEHQAALMYSLINEEPQPLARFNEKVTPDLERMVAKALAKERDERYQHIDDLLADLRRERKHLEYARAGYSTMTSTPPMAPQTREPSSADHPAISPPAPRKRKMVRTALIGGGMLALGTAAVLFNPFNFQVTTQKSTATTQSSLAVLYFQNIVDPEDKDHTGDMLADLLVTALSQTKGLEVVSRERLYDIQKQLGQTDTKTIPAALATQVAQRAGVTTMLMGSILQKQPALIVTFRLIDVHSGNILGSQRLSGFAPDRIFALVDTMAVLVNADLNVPAAGPAEARSVADVTTKSPEAYRSYIDGLGLLGKLYAQEAKAALARAIELDSNFAMAYYALARVAMQSSGDALSPITKAWEFKDRVTERERLIIQSTYVSVVERDIPQSIKIDEEIIQKFPYEQETYLSLGVKYETLGESDKARQVLRLGLERDSLDKNLWNVLAYSLLGAGRREEALAAIDRYLRLAPGEPNPYDSKGDIYFSFGELDSAEYWWRKALTFRPDFGSDTKLAFRALLNGKEDEATQIWLRYASNQGEGQEFLKAMFSQLVLEYHGELKKAESEATALMAGAKRRNDRAAIAALYEDQVLGAYETGNRSAMLDYATRRVKEAPDLKPNIFSGRDLLAFALVVNGRNEEAEQLIREIERDLKKVSTRDQARLDHYHAMVAYQEGAFGLALDQFDKAFAHQATFHAPQYFHALSLLKAGGRTREAIAELERLTWWLFSGNSLLDMDFGVIEKLTRPVAVAKVHYWLGVAYEQQGEKEKAVREYMKFAQLWKNADFRSPELEDAKLRLAKMQKLP